MKYIFNKNETNFSLDNFDIIHQHGIWLPQSIITKNCSKNKIKIISPHGLLQPEALKNSKVKKFLSYYLYEKNNLNNANYFFACSDNEAVNLRNFGIKQPIITIPNGISLDWLQSPKTKEREIKGSTYDSKRKKFYFFYQESMN